MSVLALPIALVGTVLAVILASVRRVPEGSAFTVHRMGRYARTLAPGIRFVVPLIERVSQRVSLIGHTVPVAEASVSGAVYYQIIDPRQTGEAIEAIDAYVERMARETLRSFTPIQHGEPGLDQRVRQRLNEVLERRGLRVVRCVLPVSA